MVFLLVLIFPFFSFIYMQEDGVVVKNVTAAQRTDGSKILDITYDLESHELYSAYDVKVMVEWDGVDHEFLLTNCKGDVWYNVFPGINKQIECQLTSEVDSQSLSGNFYINVLAKATATSELPDSFEFVSIDVSNDIAPTALIKNNYDLMKYEVTAAQYVGFLNSLLSSAVNVTNNDTDGWSDMEGGETFNRIYELPNDQWVQIYYSNRGGQNISGEYIDNDAKGYGYIFGSFDKISQHDNHMSEQANNQISNTEYWLRLDEISSEDNYAKIQFSSSASGDNDFSFFISEGKGNHPVATVSFYGADAFADYYGLRIPQAEELIYPLYYEFMLNDECLLDQACDESESCGSIYSSNTCIFNHTYSANWEWDDLIYYNIIQDPCNSYNFSCIHNTSQDAVEQSCQDVNPDFINCSTWPVGAYATGGYDGSWYEIYDLFGNVAEISYRERTNFTDCQNNEFFTVHQHVLVGGSFNFEDILLNLYKFTNNCSTLSWGEDGYGNGMIENPNFQGIGFRCARNVSHE